MMTRRTILLATAGAIFAAAAHADDASARAFVTAIYDKYKGKNAKGVPLDNDRTIRRYFEPSLAALIIKDEKDAARRKEVPTLDGDPFVDAQDWDINNIDIALADTAPDKVTATVKFQNSDQPTTVVLALVKAGNDWRIGDITWQHDGKPETLRGLYAH
jgi:hypothetical protein